MTDHSSRAALEDLRQRSTYRRNHPTYTTPMSATTETTMLDLLERWYALESRQCKAYRDMDSPHEVTIYQVHVNGALRQVGSRYRDEDLRLNAYGPALVHAAVLEAVRARGWFMESWLYNDGVWYAMVKDEQGREYHEESEDATLTLLSAYVQALEARDA